MPLLLLLPLAGTRIINSEMRRNNDVRALLSSLAPSFSSPFSPTNTVTTIKLQMYGFNSDLYHNMSEARFKSQGMVGLAVMIQVRPLVLSSLTRSISSAFYEYRN